MKSNKLVRVCAMRSKPGSTSTGTAELLQQTERGVGVVFKERLNNILEKLELQTCYAALQIEFEVINCTAFYF